MNDISANPEPQTANRSPIRVRAPKAPQHIDKLTSRIRKAVQAMIWQGLSMQDAARDAGLHPYTMRLALKKPHVMLYHNEQLQVLRESRRSRNFHRLVEIADADNNMPAVNAIKVLEEMAGGSGSTASQPDARPFSINIINGHLGQADVRERGPVIDVTPGQTTPQPADDECLLPNWRTPKG